MHSFKHTLSLCIVFLLVILAAGCDNGNPPESPSDIPAGPSLTIAEMPEEVILIHPSAQKFLNAGDDVQAEDLRKTLGDKDRWDVSIPAVVEFRVDGLVAPQLIKSCTAKFWKDGEPEKAKTLEVQNYANEVRLYNLERGEQYRVSLTVLLSDGVELYDEIGFRTADLPRILTVDGISNFRDFGGWKTADGSRIRQGLLYRGTELDGAVNSKYNLTSAGVAQMEEEFGIRAVLDLRYTKNYEIVERLGPNVRYHYYSVSSYVGIFANKHKVTTPYVFRVFADPDNYPLYIHCTHGMDRTGTYVYLLGALLGMREEDLLAEYRLSALYHEWLKNDDINALIAELRLLPGDSMQEKVENYLLSLGITAAEIESIRAIYLEK